MKQSARLGLGTASLGSVALGGGILHEGDEIAVATIRRAIDGGIQTIDTAPAYGEAERRVGLALADGYRQQVHLTTKTCRDFSGGPEAIATRIRRTFEQSLRRLKTDSVDQLLVHDAEDAEVLFQPGGALDTVNRLKDEGMVDAVGFGLRDLGQLRAGIESGRIDAVLTYLAFTLLDQTASTGLFPIAAKHGVRVINGSPLGMGLLVDDFDQRQSCLESMDPDGLRRQQLRRWAHEKGLTLQALALGYSMADTRIAMTLTGSRSRVEVEEALACLAEPPPHDLWKQLENDLGIPAPWTGLEGLPS